MPVFLRKIRVALTPKSWLLRTRLDNGALVSGYNRPGWGGRGIYIFRDALEPELAALGRFVKPGHTFIDIGANVGVFAVKAAKAVGETGTVISVEPFIESARQLSRNIALNKFHNCRVRNLCCGATTGEVKFFMNNNEPNAFSLTKAKAATNALSVLCVSLNDLCAWEKIERLDYLKIDAEGAEDSILAGGAETIAKFRPIIQVEVTLTSIPLPEGYRRFGVPGHLNNVFIPSERAEDIQAALDLGWEEFPT